MYSLGYYELLRHHPWYKADVCYATILLHCNRKFSRMYPCFSSELFRTSVLPYPLFITSSHPFSISLFISSHIMEIRYGYPIIWTSYMMDVISIFIYSIYCHLFLFDFSLRFGFASKSCVYGICM